MIHREKALLTIRFKTPLWASRLSTRFKYVGFLVRMNGKAFHIETSHEKPREALQFSVEDWEMSVAAFVGFGD